MIPDHLIHAEAEQQVLGAALVYPENAVPLLLSETDADCFAVPEYRTLYRVIRATAEAGLPVEPEVLREQYRTMNLGTMPGDRVAELTEAAGPVVNIPFWTAILRDRAQRRAAFTALHQHADRAADLQTPLSETAAAATVALSATDRVERPALRTVLLEAMEGIEQEGKNGVAPGWPCGLPKLDHLTRGWENGQLTLIAARPSVGKTQFAGFCAREILNAEEAVLFVTAEMSPRQLMRRLVALEAGVDLLNIQDRDWTKLAHAAGVIGRWRLTLDARSTTPGMIRLEAKRVQRTEGRLALIVVDFLQLLKADGRNENRNLEVDAIARALQRLALDEDVPVLGLSQLSRAMEKGATPRRPVLSDLRDSGGLEQAADKVVFLHAREEEDDVIRHVRRVEAIVGKNRHGRKGIVELDAYGSGRFDEVPYGAQRVVA